MRQLRGVAELPTAGLVLLAVVGVMDTLRPGVAEAVAACQGAGVRDV